MFRVYRVVSISRVCLVEGTNRQIKKECSDHRLQSFTNVSFLFFLKKKLSFLVTCKSSVPSMEWQVPMIKCDPRRCTNVGQDALPLCQYSILALVGEDAISKKRAEDMRDFIYDEWPAIRDIERDQVGFELIQMFNSSKAIDDYVRSRQYGEDTKPKIAMGVVWTAGNDENNYLYSLRQNSTNFNTPSEEGRPATSTTPDTKSLFNNYARRDDVCTPEDGTAYQGRLGFSCTGQYMYNGVLTFQRLVHDFIIHDTGAAANGFRVADGGVRYVRFPARGYVEEGFYGAIGGEFANPWMLTATVVVAVSYAQCIDFLIIGSRCAVINYSRFTLSSCGDGRIHHTRERISTERTNENDVRH